MSDDRFWCVMLIIGIIAWNTASGVVASSIAAAVIVVVLWRLSPRLDRPRRTPGP